MYIDLHNNINRVHNWSQIADVNIVLKAQPLLYVRVERKNHDLTDVRSKKQHIKRRKFTGSNRGSLSQESGKQLYIMSTA